MLRQRRLSTSNRVEVWITAPGKQGKVYRSTFRKAKAAKRTTPCVAPGAAKAAACR